MLHGAAEAVHRSQAAGLTLGTAESLTGGMVASALASVPGASAVLRGAVVAYANDVKARLLAVDASLLAEEGSVAGRVAAQMAEGARSCLGADVAVSTTGVAGPDPHDGKPVGTVFIAVASASGTAVEEFLFTGDRAAIRREACETAVSMLTAALPGEQKPPRTSYE